MEDNDYTIHGYENRDEYLKCMAEDYGIEIEIVKALADVLGEDEDFDGLICALEGME